MRSMRNVSGISARWEENYPCKIDQVGCLTQVSGQAAQLVPLASLKLSMAVYGQKLDG